MAKKKTREMRVLKLEETNFDKIRAYYVNPDEFPLSGSLDEVRKRLAEVFTLRLNGFTPTMIVKRWDKEKGLSIAQAYIDIRNSTLLFGDVAAAEKKGLAVIWQAWVEDYLLRMRQKGNDKQEGFALKLLQPLEDNEKEFNPEKLVNFDFHFTIPKEFLPYLKMAKGKGGVDDMNLAGPIDITHEEITDDEQTD